MHIESQVMENKEQNRLIHMKLADIKDMLTYILADIETLIFGGGAWAKPEWARKTDARHEELHDHTCSRQEAER